MDINLKLQDPTPYKIRVWRSVSLFAFPTFIVVSLGIQGYFLFALTFASIIFFPSYLCRAKINKFYITRLIVSESKISITYKCIEQAFEISDYKDNFRFDVIGKYRRDGLILNVYLNGKKMITQYPIGYWTSAKFKQIISAVQ